MSPPAERSKLPLWPFAAGALVLLALRWATGGFPPIHGPNPSEAMGEVFGQVVGSIGLGVVVWALIARRWILAGVIGGAYVAIVAIALVVARPWEHKFDRESLIQGCLGSCVPTFERAASAAGRAFSGEARDKAEQYCQCSCRDFNERLSPELSEQMARLGPEKMKQDAALMRALMAIGAEVQKACTARVFPEPSSASPATPP
jgi:hypothetical protein